MAKRVILHIGRAKTGTTAIQRALQENRAHLATLGFDYPSERRDHNYAVHPPRLSPDAPALRAHIDAGERDVIISAEGLQHVPPAEVRAWLAGLDVRVVVFLREQAEALASAYQQIVRAKLYAETFPQYLARNALDYAAFLDAWVDQFGRDNVIVRIYDRERFGDSVPQFLDILGIRDHTPFLLDGPDPNPSIAGALLEAKRRFNAACTGDFIDIRDRTYARMTQLALSRADYRGVVDFPEALLADTRQAHLASNERLARDFFGGEAPFVARPWRTPPAYDEGEVQAALQQIVRFSNEPPVSH